MTLLTTIAPIFGLMALGFAAVKWRVMDAAEVRGLVLFVFNFAIPALLFRSLAVMEFPAEIEWGFLIAFYVGSLATYALGMAVGKVSFGRPRRDQAIFGMTSAYANLVMMGIPIVLMALGPDASLPMLLIIAFHSATFMPLTVALIQSGSDNGEPRGRQLWTALVEVVKNPIILGILVGLVANLVSLRPWVVVDRTLEFLATTAVPCALFAMGGSLAGYRLRGDLRAPVALTIFKLALHPLLVWLVAVPVLGLDGVWVSTAVVLAAMPSAVNSYLFGARYDAAAEVAARTVLLTSGCSLATIPFVLALLAR